MFTQGSIIDIYTTDIVLLSSKENNDMHKVIV